jgi:hypothetical protein
VTRRRLLHLPSKSRLLPVCAAAVFACAVTVMLTWPQARYPLKVADHFDPYFSIWRLGHVAHALTRWPVNLFDGNIFYPERNTLAYSDAILLEGIVAAPLMWLHLSPSLAYNIVLLLGFVGSGVGMFILVRHLTGSVAASLVATTVFTALPYRTEHLMHLELQWAMFIPLSLWAVHRTMESGLWRHGLLAGLFLWLQFLSCVYYGVFLSMTLVLFVPLLLTFKGHVPFRRFAPPLVVGALGAVVFTLPYILPYAAASQAVGVRPLDEITRYSALPASYLATSSLNRFWGWTADLWGAPELRLFPGLIAVLLSLGALVHPRRRLVVLYAVTAVVCVQLSFGLNGRVYSLLLGHISALQGFRALARFGIFAGCALAVLTGLGVQALLARTSWTQTGRRAFVCAAIVAMLVEYSNTKVPLSFEVAARPAEVYQALQVTRPGAIIEFPLPNLDNLPGWDPYYQAWSVWHWRPMLNGYSGFYSRRYVEAVTELASFPDPASVKTLRALGVRYVIIHRDFYEAGKYTSLALKLATTPGLTRWGIYKDPVGVADILEVAP